MNAPTSMASQWATSTPTLEVRRGAQSLASALQTVLEVNGYPLQFVLIGLDGEKLDAPLDLSAETIWTVKALVWVEACIEHLRSVAAGRAP